MTEPVIVLLVNLLDDASTSVQVGFFSCYIYL